MPVIFDRIESTVTGERDTPTSADEPQQQHSCDDLSPEKLRQKLHHMETRKARLKAD